MSEEKVEIAKLNILRHKVTVKNGKEIVIKHNKNCKDCNQREGIISYLRDEAFIEDNFDITIKEEE